MIRYLASLFSWASHRSKRVRYMATWLPWVSHKSQRIRYIAPWLSWASHKSKRIKYIAHKVTHNSQNIRIARRRYPGGGGRSRNQDPGA